MILTDILLRLQKVKNILNPYTMTIFQLFKKVIPFTKPYQKLIAYTFLLTIIGSFAAQVNAFVLKYTVDSINDLMVAKKPLEDYRTTFKAFTTNPLSVLIFNQ